MELEIVVVVASIAFGMMILLVRPRVAALLPAGRSIGLILKDWIRPWPLAIVIYGLVVVGCCLDRTAVREGWPQFLIALGVVVAVVAVWIREIVILMALRDDELPGRFDKPIWAFLLLALPPVGMIAFRCHRASTRNASFAPQAKPKVDYAGELA